MRERLNEEIPGALLTGIVPLNYREA